MDIRGHCTASPIRPVKCTVLFVLCIQVYLMWFKSCIWDCHKEQLPVGGSSEASINIQPCENQDIFISRPGTWNQNGPHRICTSHTPRDSFRHYYFDFHCRQKNIFLLYMLKMMRYNLCVYSWARWGYEQEQSLLFYATCMLICMLHICLSLCLFLNYIKTVFELRPSSNTCEVDSAYLLVLCAYAACRLLQRWSSSTAQSFIL